MNKTKTKLFLFLLVLLTPFCFALFGCNKGGGAARYTVTVNNPENGTVTVSDANPLAGTDVTVTAKPDAGFTIAEFKVNGKDAEYTYRGSGESLEYLYVIRDIRANTAATAEFSALYAESVSAAFSQAGITVFTSDDMPSLKDKLKNALTVTAVMPGGGQTAVPYTDYTLSCADWGAGQRIVLISYQGVSAQITVDVTQVVSNGIRLETPFVQGGVTVYSTDDNDTALKARLASVITVLSDNNDGKTFRVEPAGYTMSVSGPPSGSRPVTVSLSADPSKTLTFNVTVTGRTAVSVCLDGVAAGGAVSHEGADIFASDGAAALKTKLSPFITVIAAFDTGAPEVVAGYTLSLSGNVVTVTYSSKTTTFTVNITAKAQTGVTADFATQGFIYQSQIDDDAKIKEALSGLWLRREFNDGDRTQFYSSPSEYALSVNAQGFLVVRDIALSQSFTTAAALTVTPVALSGITAAFTQGSINVYIFDTLTTLKQKIDAVPGALVITGTNNDGGTVNNMQTGGYTLTAGSLEQTGINQITLQCQGFTRTFGVTVTDSVTSVQLNLNYQGAPAPQTAAAVYGQPMPAEIPPPVRQDYVFGGFYVNQDGTGDKYYDGEMNGLKTWYITSGTYVLYAKWDMEITYKDAGGGVFSGSFTGAYPRTHTNGIQTNLAVPVRAGYYFGGWHRDINAYNPAVTAIAANETAVAGSIVYYAEWTALVTAYDFSSGAVNGFAEDLFGNLAAGAISVVGRGASGNRMLQISSVGAGQYSGMDVISVIIHAGARAGQSMQITMQTASGSITVNTLRTTGGEQNFGTGAYGVGTGLQTFTIPVNLDMGYFRMEIWSAPGWILYIDKITVTAPAPSYESVLPPQTAWLFNTPAELNYFADDLGSLGQNPLSLDGGRLKINSANAAAVSGEQAFAVRLIGLPQTYGKTLSFDVWAESGTLTAFSVKEGPEYGGASIAGISGLTGKRTVTVTMNKRYEYLRLCFEGGVWRGVFYIDNVVISDSKGSMGVNSNVANLQDNITYQNVTVGGITYKIPVYTDNIRMDIGAWEADMRLANGFEDAAEAGFSVLYPLAYRQDFAISPAESLLYLDKAYDAGLKAFVNDRDFADAENLTAPVSTVNVNYYKNHPAFLGIRIKDEPHAANNTELNTVVNQLAAKQAAVKANFPDKLGFINLVPMQAASFGSNYSNYITYVNTYNSVAKPGVLSFDDYVINEGVHESLGVTPSTVTPSSLKTYAQALSEGRLTDNNANVTVKRNTFAQIAHIRHTAKTNDIPAHAFLQTTGHWMGSGGSNNLFHKYMRQEDLRWQFAFYMTYGYQSLTHYTYDTSLSTRNAGITDAGYAYLLDQNGSRTPLYYDVQAVNREVLNWDHVYLRFNWSDTAYVRGTNTGGGRPATTVSSHFGGHPFYDFSIGYQGYNYRFAAPSNNGGLTVANSGITVGSDENMLVGLFADNDGNKGYMLTNAVNPYFNNGAGYNASVNVSFGSTYANAGVMIYANGAYTLQKLDASGNATITVPAAEGRFLIPVKTV